MDAEEVRSSAEREFRRLKLLADRALEQIDDEQFFRSLDDESNSIAILVKHLAGNLRSRWRNPLTEDGEKPDRNRDAEFIIGGDETRDSLMSAWEEGWAILFEAVAGFSPDQVAEGEFVIRGEAHTVTEALHRQLSHYGYHVGQIVLLAKHYCGSQWNTLSIPRGQSQGFNQQPSRYLGSREGDVRADD